MSTEVTLYTSIPPNISRPFKGRDLGPAWQTACISSWRASGFNVVSFNTAGEIATLRTRFAEAVTFVELPPIRTRALISDLLRAAAMSNGAVCGIINADVMIAPHSGIIQHLIEDMNGLVIAERIGLNSNTLHPTGHACMGFDAFFFRTDKISGLAGDDRWRIGETWWDYWFPLAFLAAGFVINTLPSPVLIHIDHESSWSWEIWRQSLPPLIDYLRSTDFQHPALASAIARMPEVYEDKHIHELTTAIYGCLRSSAALWVPAAGSLDDLLTHFRYALSVPPPPPPPPTPAWRLTLSRVANQLHLRKRLERTRALAAKAWGGIERPGNKL